MSDAFVHCQCFHKVALLIHCSFSAGRLGISVLKKGIPIWFILGLESPGLDSDSIHFTTHQVITLLRHVYKVLEDFGDVCRELAEGVSLRM